MLEIPHEHLLWVVEYRESARNDFNLEIIVIEAKTSPIAMDTELGLANPIEPDADSAVFSVRWRDYVAFAVRNESFALPEEGAKIGCGLGIKMGSLFHAYVTSSTFADDHYPGPLTHWYFNTNWHCFDVVSATEPVVERLAGTRAEEIVARYL